MRRLGIEHRLGSADGPSPRSDYAPLEVVGMAALARQSKDRVLAVLENDILWFQGPYRHGGELSSWSQNQCVNRRDPMSGSYPLAASPTPNRTRSAHSS